MPEKKPRLLENSSWKGLCEVWGIVSFSGKDAGELKNGDFSLKIAGKKWT
jgi:hypothetical protein